MSELNYEDFNSKTDSDDNKNKEARYQKISEEYETAFIVFSEKELLNMHMFEYFIDEFVALGDYKDSATKAEECRIKLKELQKNSHEDETEVEPPPKKAGFSDKCEEIKSEIKALSETVKKDEEKIATLKSKLEEQKTINQATKRTNILILVIILCFGPLGIIISCFLHAKQKQSVNQTNRVLKDPEILSSELNAAMKVAEKHKAELESKQKELDILLLEL